MPLERQVRYNKQWYEYYLKTMNRPPSALLEEAIGAFARNRGHALDVAAGGMRDTRLLQEEFERVTALDKDFSVTAFTHDLSPEKVGVIISSLESFNFPEEEFDLVNASLGLPFVSPRRFKGTIRRVKASIKPDGILAAHFFGEQHQWKDNSKMTFLTKEAIEALFPDSEYEIIKLTSNLGPTTIVSGETTMWHQYDLIARKRPVAKR